MANLVPWRKRKTAPEINFSNDLNCRVDPFTPDRIHPFSIFDTNGIWPRVDILETGDKITIEAEIAGMKKEDIDVSIKDRIEMKKTRPNASSKIDDPVKSPKFVTPVKTGVYNQLSW